MPRVCMTFGSYQGVWYVGFLAEDAATVLRPTKPMPDFAAVRDLVTRTNPPADVLDDFDRTVRHWSQGSVWLTVTDEQYARLTR